jgi:hypothetical protein
MLVLLLQARKNNPSAFLSGIIIKFSGEKKTKKDLTKSRVLPLNFVRPW